MTTALHPTSARRGPVVRTVVHLGRTNLFLLTWFWVIVVTAALLGTLALARVNGEVGTAVIMYARHGALWFPFAQTIILLGTALRVHVANGSTRRTFVRASLVVAVGTGLAYALVLGVLAAVERTAHHAAGWGWRITDASLADERSPLGLLLAELAVSFVAATVVGLLVGVAYEHVGGWWGTLALPLTAGPLIGVLALLGAYGGGVPAGRSSWAAAAPTLALALAVVVLAAVAYAALAGRLPLRPRTA